MHRPNPPFPRALFTACLLLLGLLVARCDSGPNDPPRENGNGNGNGNTTPGVVTRDIGPDGGTVTSDDGRLTLTIPAGALGNTETITIETITADDLGPEFDELVDVLGTANAYELGPNGLEFQQPITASITSEQTPVKNDDSLAVFVEFLFTSDGDTVEALDSLRVEADADNNTATVSGRLTHFSPFFEPLQITNGVYFSLAGVPNTLEVGKEFDADVLIASTTEGPFGGIVSLVGPAHYLDDTGAPLTPIFSDAPNTTIPLDDDAPAGAAARFKGSFSYTCTDPGMGLFDAELQVNVTFDLDSGPITATTFSDFTGGVECVEARFALAVTKDGTGSGIVSSTPGGIDCGDDCEHRFAASTAVTLTATPGMLSEFEGWSGDCDAADGNTCEMVLDADRAVTATFSSSSSSLPVGLFLLAEDLDITLPEALFLLASVDPALLGQSAHSVRSAGHAPKSAHDVQFGPLSGGFLTAVVGAEGYAVIDLATGEVVLEETGFSSTGPFFGVGAVSQASPSPNTPAVLEAFGQNGSVFTRFDRFGALAGSSPTFDIFPAGGDVISNVMTVVRPLREVDFWVFDANQNTYVSAESGAEFDDGLFDGALVSAYMHDDVLSDNVVPQPQGSFLVLTRGTESKIYLATWEPKAASEVIADLGLDARKIRCTEVGSTGQLVCAVSVFGDDRLAILTWDGESAPTPRDFVDVGDGPVGIDLHSLANGHVAVISTGFNDNTVTETEVAPDGSVVTNQTRSAPTGCQSPGHAIYVEDAEGLKVVGTCYDSGHYFIVESTL